jgi:hypothetical protein
VQRGWDRRGAAKRQPLADLQHAADHVGVLKEGKLVAAHGEFRHAGQHGEDRVVMPRRYRVRPT